MEKTTEEEWDAEMAADERKVRAEFERTHPGESLATYTQENLAALKRMGASQQRSEMAVVTQGSWSGTTPFA